MPILLISPCTALNALVKSRRCKLGPQTTLHAIHAVISCYLLLVCKSRSASQRKGKAHEGLWYALYEDPGSLRQMRTLKLVLRGDQEEKTKKPLVITLDSASPPIFLITLCQLVCGGIQNALCTDCSSKSAALHPYSFSIRHQTLAG